MLVNKLEDVLFNLRKQNYRLKLPNGKLGKITQSNLAEVMGEKVQTVNLWITGKTTPPIGKAIKLARVLGLKVEDLYDYQPEEGEYCELAVVQGKRDLEVF